MPRADNIFELPADLPVPRDDGACDHLSGLRLPALALPSPRDRDIDLSQLHGTTVVYIYPRTGRPDQALPAGWNAIPGARGCTPQSCAYRDHFMELRALGVANLFGLSTQDSNYQREAAERLHLPFELLSDEHLDFADALRLPTFEVDGMTLIRRITLIVCDGMIVKNFYPVFPPDKDAAAVLDWLS